MLSNLFTAVITTFHNKLERLSLASLSSLVECLQVRPNPTRVKHLSGAPLKGRLLALPTNIRIGSRVFYYFGKRHHAECRYAECHYAECHHAECHYA